MRPPPPPPPPFLFQDVDVESWVDPVPPRDASGRARAFVLDHAIFTITPRSGQLGAGKSVCIAVQYSHDWVGEHRLPTLLQFAHGRRVLLELEGVTLERRRQERGGTGGNERGKSEDIGLTDPPSNCRAIIPIIPLIRHPKALPQAPSLVVPPTIPAAVDGNSGALCYFCCYYHYCYTLKRCIISHQSAFLFQAYLPPSWSGHYFPFHWARQRMLYRRCSLSIWLQRTSSIRLVPQ